MNTRFIARCRCTAAKSRCNSATNREGSVKNINKITAIFDEFRLKDVEEALIQHGVKGFTLHPVRGRGRYFDSFNENHLIQHIQMEIYARAEQAKEVAQLIACVAHVNADSEGLVCTVPVNDLLWIHDKRSATDKDFNLMRIHQ